MLQKINFYFGLLMIAVYVIMSFFLLFAKDLKVLTQPNQTILGIVLLIYAGFRIYKLWKVKKDESI